MALLSCSLRSASSPSLAPHSTTRPLALAVSRSSCSGGKSSKSVASARAGANSGRVGDSFVGTEVSDCPARGPSWLSRRFDPFRVVGPRGVDRRQRIRCAGESGYATGAVAAGGGRRSTLLCSCAGLTLTPGLASALPIPAATMHDLVACAITIAGALSLLKIFDELAKRDVLDKKLSRKLVHVAVGLGYILFWPLFSTAPYAKYLCALAPAGNGLRMLGLGIGLLENEAMIKAMSREGDRRELLKGPFYYALAIVVTTVCFWRTSPVGIVALVNLCSGDGFADIIGRNFGGEFKLPWNEDKSWVGSMSFFLASTGVSLLYLLYFAHFGFLQLQPGIVTGVAIVSFLTALVESLPISTRLDDNLTVPFAAMALGQLILPS